MDLLQEMLLDKELQLYSGSEAKVSTSGTESRRGETKLTQITSKDARQNGRGPPSAALVPKPIARKSSKP